jgi:carboxyl-terminal processing protease
MQDRAAKAAVFSVTRAGGTRRVGVITLPSFYEDVEARQKGVQDYRSATRDVANLLADMRKQKVDSLLVDLRNNGGGSLKEAVELTGLFIGKVPVVQARNAKGGITVERNGTMAIGWDGPVGVLINRASASASEIFAAAIQDYGRGLILGEPSFGKGTVQTVASLDQIARNAKPVFGELKMTIAQFFRVDGSTTQLRGVTPDIGFPGSADAADFGESSFDNALPWSRIKAADYAPVGNAKAQVPDLLTLHQNRVGRDKDFQSLVEDIARAQEMRKSNVISLNEADRRKERDAQEKRLAALQSAQGADASRLAAKALQDDGLQSNERNLAKDLAAEKTKDSVKDVLLNEAVSILADGVALKQANAQFAKNPLAAGPVVVMEQPAVARTR